MMQTMISRPNLDHDGVSHIKLDVLLGEGLVDHVRRRHGAT